jgi:glutaredoxin
MKAKTNVRAGAVTVYGTDWCSWTTKQKDYLTANGIDYDYVNCEAESCPSYVEAFPTMSYNGEVIRGFKEV